MAQGSHWNLATRLGLVVLPFLLFALLASATMMWFSWRIEGAGGALNETALLRTQLYRLAYAANAGNAENADASDAGTSDARMSGTLPGQIAGFEAGLALLRTGGPERRIYLPESPAVQSSQAAMERDWLALREALGQAAAPHAKVDALAARLDTLASAIKAQLSRWWATLYLLQLATVAVAIGAAAVLVHIGYRFVLEPLGQLRKAVRGLQDGNLSARVTDFGSREFDALADGFNAMADRLQSMYHGLESKVAEKTAQLEDERERLVALYGMTTLIATATTLDELARGFALRIGRVARADGVALRWSDEANRRYLMLASRGLPTSMTDAEHCITADHCHCGTTVNAPGLRVIPLRQIGSAPELGCVAAGFKTVVSIPIRLKDRLMGEVDLFFHAQLGTPDVEHSLLEALTAHLAGAIENLRLNALEKEAAVSQERTFLARELHDSIAQSLAFLKIQVQLMHDALDSGDVERMRVVLGEIELGVGESYGDVRELLIHFRTRANDEDIEPALLTTLRKFEHQCGLRTSLRMQGHGIPLASDLQLQVLHIVQEALSNVRKHAGASRAWIDVQQHPQWRFEVCDDGAGFMADRAPRDETRVGLRIMAERAERIGASLDIVSTPGRGTSVALTLPGPARPVSLQ